MGFDWLGKAYFAVCLLLSWTASSYFQVFIEDSPHTWFVVLAVKLLGILFLSLSSSSLELALMFVIIGLFAGRARDWYCFLSMVRESSYAPRNYVVNRTKVGLLSS